MEAVRVFVKSEQSPEPPAAATEEPPVAGEGRARRGGVGRLVEGSQADDRRMIRLVRERPLLFARSTLPVASYQEQVKRLWAEVADAMGWTVAEVRRKWSHVRNSYSRHLRNEMHGVRTGRGRAVSRWYLADELEFLREHMATDTRAPPYYPPTLLKMELGGGLTSWPDPSPAPSPALDEPDHDQDEDEAYFQFFRSIYRDYQLLAPRHQRQYRRQCLIYLHELLDPADTHT